MRQCGGEHSRVSWVCKQSTAQWAEKPKFWKISSFEESKHPNLPKRPHHMWNFARNHLKWLLGPQYFKLHLEKLNWYFLLSSSIGMWHKKDFTLSGTQKLEPIWNGQSVPFYPWCPISWLSCVIINLPSLEIKNTFIQQQKASTPIEYHNKLILLIEEDKIWWLKKS